MDKKKVLVEISLEIQNGKEIADFISDVEYHLSNVVEDYGEGEVSAKEIHD